MPLMTGNFSDVAERVSKTYWFDHTQSSLKVTNSGLFPIIVDVSDETRLILAGSDYTFDEEFKKFSIRCKTKGSDKSAFSVETDSYKAAIASGGGGGGVTEAQVKTIMAPLVNAVTAGLTITSPTGNLEVGRSLTSVGFSWTIGNHGSAKSAKIRDTSANADIETLTLAASGTHTETVNITKSTPSTQNYRLDVIDNLDRIISSTVRTINWYYPVFYGSSTKASGLTEAEIEAFTKSLKANASGTYNFGAVANTYKWLFVHENFSPSSFKAGGFDMPMQAPITITITNEFGVSLKLKGYRTTNSTSGSIDLVVA